MESAVDRFIRGINSVPNKLRYLLVDRCCFALGLDSGLSEVVSIDSLNDRLSEIVTHAHVSEAVLILGILHFMIDYFENEAADSLEANKKNGIMVIKNMEESLRTAPDKIRKMFPTKNIREMVNNVNNAIENTPDYVNTAREIAEAVRIMRANLFPAEYWKE